MEVRASTKSPHRDGPLDPSTLLFFNIGASRPLVAVEVKHCDVPLYTMRHTTALHPVWLGIPTDALPAAGVIMALSVASVLLAPWVKRVVLRAAAWVADNSKELHDN